jgi:hypothetical protein
LRDATPAEQASTKSIGLFYLSIWKNADSAQVFTKLYAKNLGRKYSSLQLQTSASLPSSSSDGSVEQVYSTDEGPVVITTRGKLIFVAESFPLPLARKLTSLILDAQGGGAMRMTSIPQPSVAPDSTRAVAESTAAPSGQPSTLTGDLVHFFGECGVMKAAVDAELRAVAR